MAGDVPPGWETKIMHGSITLGGIIVAGADPPPGQYEAPKGFRIFLEADDPADTERLFHALADNATIEMPLQQTFWSLRFGVLTDQFGIPWTISYASTNDRMLIPGHRNPSQNVCTGPPGESRRNEGAGEIAKVGLEP